MSNMLDLIFSAVQVAESINDWRQNVMLELLKALFCLIFGGRVSIMFYKIILIKIILCTLITTIFFQYITQDEIQIDGFVNLAEKRWVRMVRRDERETLDYMWGDTEEARDYAANGCVIYDDIFHLRKLFDLEPYDIDIPFGSENWDEPDDPEEPSYKRLRMS